MSLCDVSDWKPSMSLLSLQSHTSGYDEPHYIAIIASHWDEPSQWIWWDFYCVWSVRVSFHVLRQQRFWEMQSRRTYAAAGAVDTGGQHFDWKTSIIIEMTIYHWEALGEKSNVSGLFCINMCRLVTNFRGFAWLLVCGFDMIHLTDRVPIHKYHCRRRQIKNV